MLSLFRLGHLGQGRVFIYLIKIPPLSWQKVLISSKCTPRPIYLFIQSKPPPLNSKDYLCWFAVQVGWTGGFEGCRIYWLVRILARLLSTLTAGQISSQRAIWLPNRTALLLFPHPFFLFIIHREVCASVITASSWLSQPCYSTICMADLLRTTTFECCRCSWHTWIIAPVGL